tara:strand:+ start:740 stop:1513 length:774 start_codon:yes stop_codon:yes gene_type:complete
MFNKLFNLKSRVSESGFTLTVVDKKTMRIDLVSQEKAYQTALRQSVKLRKFILGADNFYSASTINLHFKYPSDDTAKERKILYDITEAVIDSLFFLCKTEETNLIRINIYYKNEIERSLVKRIEKLANGELSEISEFDINFYSKKQLLYCVLWQRIFSSYVDISLNKLHRISVYQITAFKHTKGELEASVDHKIKIGCSPILSFSEMSKRNSFYQRYKKSQFKKKESSMYVENIKKRSAHYAEIIKSLRLICKALKK